MQRLYQWLSERASFFRYDTVGHATSSRVCTETTIRREGVTLLVGGATPLGLDICPLCGSKLTPEQLELTRHQLSGEPISQKPVKLTGQLSE